MADLHYIIGEVEKKAPTAELGVSGLKRFGGNIDEEFLVHLKGLKGVDVYTEMAFNDPVVGACLAAIKLLCRQAKWRVDPASDDQHDKDIAQFVDECRNDMSVSWADFVAETLSMLQYGWAFHEVVYKLRKGYKTGSRSGDSSMFNDGRIGWRKMPIRAQTSLQEWVFDPQGGIMGMKQMAPPDFHEIIIPITRALLFRTTTEKNSPEGYSILRNAYRPWYYKKRIEEIEGMGVERDLAGIPMATVPPELLSNEATQDEKKLYESIKALVQNVRRDQAEGIIFPSEFDDAGNQVYTFQLISGGGGRTFATDQIIGRYDQRIAMALMADFILLGHENVGSYALGASKTTIFTTAINAWLDSIADVLNRHAVPRLLDLNGLTVDKFPLIAHEDVQGPDLGALGAYLSALAGLGMGLVPDPKLENYLRGVGGLPPKPNEGVGVQPQTPENTPSVPGPEADMRTAQEQAGVVQ
jgi:hypothetical protein